MTEETGMEALSEQDIETISSIVERICLALKTENSSDFHRVVALGEVLAIMASVTFAGRIINGQAEFTYNDYVFHLKHLMNLVNQPVSRSWVTVESDMNTIRESEDKKLWN